MLNGCGQRRTLAANTVMRQRQAPEFLSDRIQGLLHGTTRGPRRCAFGSAAGRLPR